MFRKYVLGDADIRFKVRPPPASHRTPVAPYPAPLRQVLATGHSLQSGVG